MAIEFNKRGATMSNNKVLTNEALEQLF